MSLLIKIYKYHSFQTHENCQKPIKHLDLFGKKGKNPEFMEKIFNIYTLEHFYEKSYSKEIGNSPLHMTCEGSYNIASGSGTDLRTGVIKYSSLLSFTILLVMHRYAGERC